MQSRNRRTFILQIAAGSSVLAAASQSSAQPAKVDEKDPQAVALGYVHDTTKADTKKFPKHSKDQKCAGCQVYAGKAGDATGPCGVFGGKLVSANGWCSAWIKKA